MKLLFALLVLLAGVTLAQDAPLTATVACSGAEQRALGFWVGDWTPTNQDGVRQHWQVSRNAGKTWETVFDGLYERTVPEAE